MTYDNRIVKITFFSIFRIYFIKAFKPLLGLGNHAVVSDSKDFLIIHCKMTYTAVMIKISLKNLLSRLRAFNLLIIQVGINHIIDSLALPILAKLYEFFPVFIANEIELIVLTLFKRFLCSLV